MIVGRSREELRRGCVFWKSRIVRPAGSGVGLFHDRVGRVWIMQCQFIRCRSPPQFSFVLCRVKTIPRWNGARAVEWDSVIVMFWDVRWRGKWKRRRDESIGMRPSKVRVCFSVIHIFLYGKNDEVIIRYTHVVSTKREKQ